MCFIDALNVFQDRETDFRLMWWTVSSSTGEWWSSLDDLICIQLYVCQIHNEAGIGRIIRKMSNLLCFKVERFCFWTKYFHLSISSTLSVNVSSLHRAFTLWTYLWLGAMLRSTELLESFYSVSMVLMKTFLDIGFHHYVSQSLLPNKKAFSKPIKLL